MENNNLGYELGWDAAIENDSPEFILLPEGDYDFFVESFERGRHNGSEKLPPCNKATIRLRISTTEGDVTIMKDLFLHSKCEGMLCAFFTCIGQRKHGERFSMNWNAVPGARGKAHIAPKEYNGKKYNEVKKFIEPDEVAAPQQVPQQTPYQQQTMPLPNYTDHSSGNAGYTPGKF